MRTREKIEEDVIGLPSENLYQKASIEILLDIRELLSQEKLEKQYPYIGPSIEGKRINPPLPEQL